MSLSLKLAVLIQAFWAHDRESRELVQYLVRQHARYSVDIGLGRCDAAVT